MKHLVELLRRNGLKPCQTTNERKNQKDHVAVVPKCNCAQEKLFK